MTHSTRFKEGQRGREYAVRVHGGPGRSRTQAYKTECSARRKAAPCVGECLCSRVFRVSGQPVPTVRPAFVRQGFLWLQRSSGCGPRRFGSDISHRSDHRPATLVGTVTDSTGAVVPSARVAVVNKETAFRSETLTTPDRGITLSPT